MSELNLLSTLCGEYINRSFPNAFLILVCNIDQWVFDYNICTNQNSLTHKINSVNPALAGDIPP